MLISKLSVFIIKNKVSNLYYVMFGTLVMPNYRIPYSRLYLYTYSVWSQTYIGSTVSRVSASVSTDVNVIRESTSHLYYNNYEIKAPVMRVSVFNSQLWSILL